MVSVGLFAGLARTSCLKLPAQDPKPVGRLDPDADLISSAVGRRDDNLFASETVDDQDFLADAAGWKKACGSPCQSDKSPFQRGRETSPRPALASEWSRNPPGAIKDACKIVKGIKRRKTVVNGSRTVDAARLAVVQAARDLRKARALRHTWHAEPERAAKLEFKESRHARLDLFRKRAFSSVLKTAPYRFDTLQDIDLTGRAEEVGVSQSDYLDWDYYSKATRYPKKVVEADTTMPAT